ncbi:hypothetical protein AYI68_g1862, partial [Smittium mucronatum]
AVLGRPVHERADVGGESSKSTGRFSGQLCVRGRNNRQQSSSGHDRFREWEWQRQWWRWRWRWCETNPRGEAANPKVLETVPAIVATRKARTHAVCDAGRDERLELAAVPEILLEAGGGHNARTVRNPAERMYHDPARTRPCQERRRAEPVPARDVPIRHPDVVNKGVPEEPRVFARVQHVPPQARAPACRRVPVAQCHPARLAPAPQAHPQRTRTSGKTGVVVGKGASNKLWFDDSHFGARMHNILASDILQTIALHILSNPSNFG